MLTLQRSRKYNYNFFFFRNWNCYINFPYVPVGCKHITISFSVKMQNPSVSSKSGLINNCLSMYHTNEKQVISTRARYPDTFIYHQSRSSHDASFKSSSDSSFFFFFSILSRMARQSLAVNPPVVHSRSVPFKRLSYSNRWQIPGSWLESRIHHAALLYRSPSFSPIIHAFNVSRGCASSG